MQKLSVGVFDTGDWIRDYQILARLKAGGMATLYLGRRQGPGGFSRPVAIKVIHPHLSQDENFIRMFIDEAVLSARISHPNVVHVEEFGEEQGQYFLVMEYVDGCSLSQLKTASRKKGEKLSPEIATYIAIKVAEGLYAAHNTVDAEHGELRIVHRDVSPGNVLLSREGHVKLIDFGVAKAAGRFQHTDVGSFKGKVRYMSPEQASGQSLDQRTDVYSLGIVLWEILTSERLFIGDTDFAVLQKVREPEITPPSRFNPQVSPELDAAILKALARNPDDRPANAYEFRRLLVSACPEALAVEGTQIGTLVRSVPAEVRDSLPPSSYGTGDSRSALRSKPPSRISGGISRNPPPLASYSSAPPPLHSAASGAADEVQAVTNSPSVPPPPVSPAESRWNTSRSRIGSSSSNKLAFALGGVGAAVVIFLGWRFMQPSAPTASLPVNPPAPVEQRAPASQPAPVATSTPSPSAPSVPEPPSAPAPSPVEAVPPSTHVERAQPSTFIPAVAAFDSYAAQARRQQAGTKADMQQSAPSTVSSPAAAETPSANTFEVDGVIMTGDDPAEDDASDNNSRQKEYKTVSGVPLSEDFE